MNYKKSVSKELGMAFMVVLFFVSISYFTQKNQDLISGFIYSGGYLSVFAYISVAVIAIVAAPLTSIPLIPLVVGVWGIFWTSVFSVVGWFIGSMVAFWLARKFGAPFVSRFESLKKARSIAASIPEKKMFWYLIFLRITIPVDLLSYALGFFTKISWKMFAVTTFIGIIPATFAFSYLGTLPVMLQVPIFLTGLFFVAFYFLYSSRRMP